MGVLSSVGRSVGHPKKSRCARIRTTFSYSLNAVVITTIDNFVKGSSLTISDASSVCEL